MIQDLFYISHINQSLVLTLKDLQIKNGGIPPNIMGLEQRQEGKFITILGGKFTQKVPEGTEGSVSRVNKLGATVYEKHYETFTGKLVSIKVQDGNYGKTWNFGFKDSGELYTLQLSYSNSFATAFLKMLPNIDLSKEMRVSPSVKMVDGKNRSSLFINQDGQPVKHAYTKENPNGMPDMEQVTVKGELIWDDTKRIDFLHNMVQTTIIPKLAGIVVDTTPAPFEQKVEIAETVEEDDQPF